MFSEIYCVLKGKVQRVGFRDYIEQYAREQGVFGWVRNNTDGSVELVIQGTPDQLKACIEVLNQGTPLTHVESLSVDWRTPAKQFDEFRVITSYEK